MMLQLSEVFVVEFPLDVISDLKKNSDLINSATPAGFILFTASPIFNVKEGKISERETRGSGRERSFHPTPSHLPFCAGVQFSRDSLPALNDRIKIRENRGR